MERSLLPTNNRDKLAESWNPDEQIENLWKRIRTIRDMATHGADPISDGTTIELMLTNLTNAGVYSHTITTWHDKEEINQTWINFFQAHFKKQEKEQLRQLTAQAAGYHGAAQAKGNLVHPVVTPPIPPIAQAAAAAAPPAALNHVSNSVELFYCWSKGLSKNPQHASAWR
jgi:hypothetical protein